MRIERLILDMDGVLWHGDTPVPGLGDFFTTVGRLQLPFALATNNATRTVDQYVAKFARFGVTVAPEQVVTSAKATAAFLRRGYPAGTNVFVVGERGLHAALVEADFTIINDQSPLPQAALVVVGYNRQVDYALFADAALQINKGARFVGTNPDVNFPSERGRLPGAGALLAFLAAATGVTPTVIGKPGPYIFEEALARLAAPAAGTVMVGDRLGTDIAGAQAAGLATILLLSGISRQEDIAREGIRPDLVLPDLAALTAQLPALSAVVAS